MKYANLLILTLLVNIGFSQSNLRESSQWSEFIIPLLKEQYDLKQEKVLLFQDDIRSYPVKDINWFSFLFEFLENEKGINQKQFQIIYDNWMQNWLMTPDYWKVSDITLSEKDSILLSYQLDDKTLFDFVEEDYIIFGISPVCILPNNSYFLFVEYFNPSKDKHLAFYLMNWSDSLNRYQIYFSRWL